LFCSKNISIFKLILKQPINNTTDKPMYDDSIVNVAVLKKLHETKAQKSNNFKLLKELCQVYAPSGNESRMKDFILAYIERHKSSWKVQPTILEGDNFQDAILLVFGEPKTVVFSHIDSIGYMVRYEKELIKIGGPRIKDGYKLWGYDSKGKVNCTLRLLEDTKEEKEKKMVYEADREIDRGTDLAFECDFRETEDSVQSCYLDNRLGCWVALRLAETLENGIIAFSCYEEVGGGSAAVLAKYIYENYKVRQALICDITWVTTGVLAGKGVAISMRDSLLPRRTYVQKLIKLAEKAGIPYQIEVENAGGSDGKDLQTSPYPFDWCFVGAPEENVHTPDEKVNKADIDSMLQLYQYLMKEL
jgi:putative aminopeptidase FrvX